MPPRRETCGQTTFDKMRSTIYCITAKYTILKRLIRGILSTGAQTRTQAHNTLIISWQNAEGRLYESHNFELESESEDHNWVYQSG